MPTLLPPSINFHGWSLKVDGLQPSGMGETHTRLIARHVEHQVNVPRTTSLGGSFE